MGYKASLIIMFFVGILVSLSINCFGQSTGFVVKSGEGEQLFVTSDSLEAKEFLFKEITDKQKEGFFNISYEVINKDSATIYKLNMGERYKWAVLKKGNLPESFLGNYNFEENFNSGKPFSAKQVQKLFSGIIRKAENTGYPFAYIRFDSIQIDENKINAIIDFNQGPYITFDSLKIIGYTKVHKSWLAAYMGVQRGKPFNQKAVNRIKDRVDGLSFLSLNGPPQLSFQNDEATIYLDLKEVKSNEFDALIGFAQGQDNQLLITGKAEIGLSNLFKRGHELQLNWNRIRESTQDLMMAYDVPNIFNTPFSLGGGVELFRQDTSFFNRRLNVSIDYVRDRSKFGFFSRSFKSNETSSEHLDSINDLSIGYVGVSFLHNRLNHPVFATKGWKAEVKAAVGSKEVELSSVNSVSDQYDIYVRLSNYQPFENGFLVNTLMSQMLFNEKLYFNDLIRTGGINSIRGFPESYFYVSQYYILRNEYHLTFNEGSSFLLLVDGGILTRDQPYYAYSFGLGFDLKLNNGIFELIYALGKEESVPISFDNSVLHFGYKAIF